MTTPNSIAVLFREATKQTQNSSTIVARKNKLKSSQISVVKTSPGPRAMNKRNGKDFKPHVNANKTFSQHRSNLICL